MAAARLAGRLWGVLAACHKPKPRPHTWTNAEISFHALVYAVRLRYWRVVCH